ncbi:hypothetical protein XM38_042580 [Halomicronema hongdechloris C2206]|uniref:NfeD-like C-terminal domain-containing protein n=1 Tax=Halomicronema hongdechloris C2206 TaxID=1641165 RepID=A0A1V8NFM6_9CYAN|nr:NfeD family protein [Halomicronema hongdechloris]ASC73294.1 hypothetical protein XM38_042580 [Halomicronema hongdechloris C2206]
MSRSIGIGNALIGGIQAMAKQGKATVERIIQPGQRGRVHFQATYWFGICPDPVVLLPGMDVTVVGRRGNTLIVRPMESQGVG